MRYALIAALLLSITTADASEKQDGKALFDEHCAACHGLDGMGGVGTPLALPSFLNSVSNDYLSMTIRHGRPGRVMPAFQKLAHSEVASIVSHMRSWSDKPAPKEVYRLIKGNPNIGRKLFAQHCAECHGKEGEGGEGTGVTFSRPRDLPIISPALNNPGFLAAASNQMIKNAILNGREGTPMDPYRNELSDQQANDITLFIRSLEGKALLPQPIKENVPMVLRAESPYSFEETVNNVRNAAGAANFVVIRTDFLEHGLKPPGKENPKMVLVDFCSFSLLNEALKIDPRVGIFLPCRVSISEHRGKVYISSVNPIALGTLYNDTSLYQAFQTLTDIYYEILHQATL
mgnify:CR=1 FL=1